MTLNIGIIKKCLSPEKKTHSDSCHITSNDIDSNLELEDALNLYLN